MIKVEKILKGSLDSISSPSSSMEIQIITMKDLTNGQHTKTRQHHNST